MENKKEKLEDFKTAISSTVRSLSNSQEIEISFGNQAIKSSKNSIRLPDLEQGSNKLNYEKIRAIADSKSLNLRFSDVKTLKKYEPEGNISKKLYSISEKIRCEKIGTSYFKGVKKNIEKYYYKRLSGLDLKSSEDKIIESFENYLRVKFLNFKNESQIDKKLKPFKKDLNDQLKNRINDLKDLALDQEKFNSLVSKMITDMSLDENINEEDQLRADMYSFLANLFRSEPDADLINQLKVLESDDSPIGKSIKTLSKLALSLDLPTIRDEYVRIFVGVGRGEILPFASYYLTGFLKDKPLAKLRQDMEKIGIKLKDNVKEPEDHIASIFDMMAGLIVGKFNKKFSIAEQRDFFNKHLAPWVDLLMRDIESSKIAVFYSPIGTIGKEFMEIERASFSMNVSG